MTMHDADTRKNFILKYRDMFCYTALVATTLQNVQMLTDKDTLSELGNSITNDICRSILQDSSQPVTEVATTRLILLSFWIKHQDQTLHEGGVVSKALVGTTLMMINALKEQKCLEDAWASENKESNHIT
jgi:hypothetical protein